MASDPIAPEPSVASDAPPRLLGIDLGSRRIGVAITDALGLTVQPLLTISSNGPHLDAKSIARLVRRYAIAELVVGLPVHLSGEHSPRADRVIRFVDDRLRPLLERPGQPAIPVHLFDERLSTHEAHQRLDLTRGPVQSRKDRARRDDIDQLAAVVILEDFLAHRAHRQAIQARAAALATPEEPPVPSSAIEPHSRL